MEKQYSAQLLRFNDCVHHTTLSLKRAIDLLRTDEAVALVMDVVPPGEVLEWWEDEGFTSSPFTKNAHHAGIVATAVTLGQLQREQKEKLVAKAGEYFALAGKINKDLCRTKFAHLVIDALDARPLTMDGLYPFEFLGATRRVYDPHDRPFNFAPHCDDVTYSRDTENWPLRQQYPKQLGLFLTVQTSGNDAGFVVWDCEPKSRAELDRMHAEYMECGKIAELERSAKFVVRPQPGQVTVFRSKKMHAVERCNSRRLTIGLFLVDDKDGWRFFD